MLLPVSPGGNQHLKSVSTPLLKKKATTKKNQNSCIHAEVYIV